jgi:hypothetical protein
MSAAILLQAALEGFSLLRVVQTSAVLSGLVPYGLFLLIAVAYTVGAVKCAGQGALVQRGNAVESVSNVDVVCNAAVLTEGWDCPEISCLVLARPTRSLALYRQKVGRVLRPSPGKTDALILDHAGAVFEHGFVEEPTAQPIRGAPPPGSLADRDAKAALASEDGEGKAEANVVLPTDGREGGA